MRRFVGGMVAALALITGSVFVAAPAQADTVTFSYTVTASDPMTHGWPDRAFCSIQQSWSNSPRNAVSLPATVSVTGNYTFQEIHNTHDGRFAIFAGSYDPADVSNCLIEIDETGTVELTAGTEYTILGTGYNRAHGTFSYEVSGPGVLQVGEVPVVTASASVDEAYVGESVDLSATVAAPTAPGADLSGTAEFFANGTSLGSVPVDAAGEAQMPNVVLPEGSNDITVWFPGNNFLTAAWSLPVTVTVSKRPTQTALTVAPSPLTVGEEAVLTASVDQAAATGTVEFFADGVSLGVEPVTAAGAALAVPGLDVGVYSLTAAYSGDALYASSMSAAEQLTVNQVVTRTVLSVDRTSVVDGEDVALTALVQGASPSGTVEFYAGGVSVGSAVVEQGVAVLPAVRLPVGESVVTAAYLGDARHAGSVSQGVTVTVTAKPKPAPKPKPEPKPQPKPKPESQQGAVLAKSGSAQDVVWLGGGLMLAAGASLLLARRKTR